MLETSNSGGHVEDVATLYDDAFKGKNVRVKFTTFENALGASIKTSSDGNHYIEAEGINTRWPQVGVNNFGDVKFGNGIYTVFIDTNATGASSFAVHSNMTSAYGSSIKHLDGKNAAGNGWAYTDQSWATYSYSYEITDDTNLPGSGAYFSFGANGGKVAFDNYKLYYKPFTATITLKSGDYPEFGDRTVANISTTGENTGADIVAAIQADLDVCGREFVGLMDEYGDMVDLDKALVIPGDVTYTIVWGEADDRAPETIKKNSIRISTNEHSGIRFAANAKKVYTLDENTTKYGWLVVSASALEKKGVAPTSLTKETGAQYGINVKTGYNYDKSSGEAAKHLEEDDETVMLTMVVYNIQPKDYAKEICVRPFIEIDGVTYYGVPFKRSIYEVAKELQKDYTYGEEEDDFNGRYEQDYIDYIDGIVSSVEGAAN